jgi:hypothetical protein
MSISRSRDRIHSSSSGHSSSPTRKRNDCPFHRCSEGGGRVVYRWRARVSLPRTTRNCGKRDTTALLSCPGHSAIGPPAVLRTSGSRAFSGELIEKASVTTATLGIVWWHGTKQGIW